MHYHGFLQYLALIFVFHIDVFYWVANWCAECVFIMHKISLIWKSRKVWDWSFKIMVVKTCWYLRFQKMKRSWTAYFQDSFFFCLLSDKEIRFFFLSHFSISFLMFFMLLMIWRISWRPCFLFFVPHLDKPLLFYYSLCIQHIRLKSLFVLFFVYKLLI